MDSGRVIDRLCVHEDAVTCVSLSDDVLVTFVEDFFFLNIFYSPIFLSISLFLFFSASWDSTVRVWKCKDGGIDRNYLCYFELDDEVQRVVVAKDQRTAIGFYLIYFYYYSCFLILLLHFLVPFFFFYIYNSHVFSSSWSKRRIHVTFGPSIAEHCENNALPNRRYLRCVEKECVLYVLIFTIILTFPPSPFP